MPCAPLWLWFSAVFSYRQYGKEKITLRTKGDHRMHSVRRELKDDRIWWGVPHVVSTCLVFRRCIWDHRTQSPESSTNHTANHSPETMLAQEACRLGIQTSLLQNGAQKHHHTTASSDLAAGWKKDFSSTLRNNYLKVKHISWVQITLLACCLLIKTIQWFSFVLDTPKALQKTTFFLVHFTIISIFKVHFN